MPFSLMSAQEAQKVNSGEAWVPLITVRHDDFAEPIRFAVSRQTISSRGNDYLPWIADIQFPDSVPGQTSHGVLVLDNVDQTILDSIDALEGSMSADLEIIIDSFPDDVLRAWLDFAIESISVDLRSITGQLKGYRYADENTPWLTFTPLHFPALFRS